ISTPTAQADVGVSYNYAVEAIDPGNLPLTYSLLSAPSGMAIDPNTGALTWTPTAAQTGAQSVVVLVQNTEGNPATQSFALTVSNTATGSIQGTVFNDLHGSGVQDTASVPTQTYDAAKQFSATTNPNGVWSYGWRGMANGSFNLDQQVTPPAYSGLPID